MLDVRRMLVCCLAILFVPIVMSVANAAEEENADLGEIVVTPAGYDQLAIDYPGNVTVIDRKEIEESNAKYVYELLRREPGIYVSDYTHAGKTVTVDMRGFGEYASRNVLVLLNGRRLNEVDISGTDWSQVPLENVERIELSRGSGSVLYGDNATAGVINIITKKGGKGHKAGGGAEFGSYKYRDYYTYVNGSEDFLAYNLFFEQESLAGYRLNGDYDGYDAMGSITIYPEDNISVEMEGGYHKDWYGLPAGLQRSEIDAIGRRGSTTPNDRSKTENTYFRVKPAFSLYTGDMEHIFCVDVWGRKKRLDTTTWAEFLGWYASWDSSQVDSKGGSVKYENRWEGEDVTNHLVSGLDVFTAENRLLTVTPQWGTYNQLKIKKQTAGLYANDEINIFDKIMIAGGYRYEWVEYVFDQSRNAGRYEEDSPEEYALDLGVEYKYLPKGAVYGRFSRSFRFPATDEFYSRWTGLNSGLEHQSDDTWEVGLKDGNWSWVQPSVNFFWMRTKNEIFYDPTVGAFGDNRNYDRTRRFGIESGILSEPIEQLDLYGNYTYMRARYDGGQFAGNHIPMVPEHKITFGINIFPMKFVEINFNAEYVSEQYSINDDMNRLPRLKEHFVCNGKITMKYEGIKVFFGINNIFDSRYSEIASSNVAGTVTDYFPAPERNYVFGVTAEF